MSKKTRRFYWEAAALFLASMGTLSAFPGVRGFVQGAYSQLFNRSPQTVWSKDYEKNQRSLDLAWSVAVEESEAGRSGGGRSPASIENMNLSETWISDFDRRHATFKDKSKGNKKGRRLARLPYLRAAANLDKRDTKLAEYALNAMTSEIPNDSSLAPSDKAEDLQTMMWTYLAASDGSQSLVDTVSEAILAQAADPEQQQMMYCEFARFYPEEQNGLATTLRSSGVMAGSCGGEAGIEEGTEPSRNPAVAASEESRAHHPNHCAETGDLAEYECLSNRAISPIADNVGSLNGSVGSNIGIRRDEESSTSPNQGPDHLSGVDGPARPPVTPVPTATPTPKPPSPSPPPPSPRPSPSNSPQASPGSTPRPTGSGSGTGTGT